MTEAVALFAGVFFVGLLTCRGALRLVRGLSILDHPNERSSHAAPRLRGGGLGILAALVPGAVAGSVLLPFDLSVAGGFSIGVAVAALAILGWMDDRRGVRPATKLVVQLSAATGVVLVVGGVRSVALPGVGELGLGVVGPVLTVAWLVAFSNGFNFMDGIDGIAALFTGVAGLYLATASILAGQDGTQWLAIPIAASSFAFLSVNWSPARVFMGDVGSLSLGFLLALTAVLGNRAGVPFAAAFLMLGPFLFDTAVTILARAARGDNVTRAHRSHLYQRLAACGWSHARISAVYGGWTVLTGGLGLLYLHDSTGVRALALSVAAASGMGMLLLVRGQERKRRAVH